MLKTETRNRLEEFIKRADYIRSLSYLDGKDNIVGGEIKKVGDKWQVDFYQPSDEKRDALLFNLRLFLQNKDDISLGRLTELYDDHDLSNLWRVEYEHWRKLLNESLDTMRVEGPRGKLTNRDILNMFLYGKFGHYDQDDRSYKLYQEWVTDENLYEMLHNTFHSIVVSILAIIINISVASREELNRHRQNLSSS